MNNEMKNSILKNYQYEYIYIGNIDNSYINNVKYEIKCDKLSKDLIILNLKKQEITDPKADYTEQYNYESGDKNCKASIVKKKDGIYYFKFEDNKTTDDLERLKGNKKKIDEIKLSEVGYFFKTKFAESEENYIFINNLDTFYKENGKMRKFYIIYLSDGYIEILDNKESIDDFLFLYNPLLKNIKIHKKLNVKGDFYNLVNTLYEGDLDLSNLVFEKKHNLESFFSKINIKNLKMPHIKVSSLEKCFSKCSEINSIDLKNVIVEEPISMLGCFGFCEKLKDIILPNSLKLNSLSGTFLKCKSLEKVNIDKIDIELYPTNSANKIVIYDLQMMFSICRNLKKINLNNIKFIDNKDYPINVFNIFYGCTNLTECIIENIDITDKNMSENFISGCKNLETLRLGIIGNPKDPELNEKPNIKNLYVKNKNIDDIKNSTFFTENHNSIKNVFINNIQVPDEEKIKIDNELNDQKKLKDNITKDDVEIPKNIDNKCCFCCLTTVNKGCTCCC